jgi:hypothetical protein
MISALPRPAYSVRALPGPGRHCGGWTEPVDHVAYRQSFPATKQRRDIAAATLFNIVYLTKLVAHATFTLFHEGRCLHPHYQRNYCQALFLFVLASADSRHFNIGICNA